MSVLRFIKDLIGAEDINWGDSSTTFNRETHVGGSVSLRYIDAEVIPSTTLGGYIGDHLHEQNTDSLTTATTFGINASGNSVVLDGTGLTATRTFSFPDTSDQELVGATDLASTATGLGASTVGVEDTSGYFTNTNVEGVLGELGEDVNTLINEESNKGRREGLKLAYSSTSAVTISGGMWGHSGTTDQYVYTNTALTFTFGSAGSNSNSDDLAPSTLFYLYIDDSAIVTLGSPNITAAEFIDSTDEPSYSDSKHGWYASGLTNTSPNDRCIGAILTNSSSEIIPFDVVSNTFFRYRLPVQELATASSGATYQALALNSSVPEFSTMARLRITAASAGTTINFDTTSSAVTPETHTISTANSAGTYDVSLNTSQGLYYYGSAPNNIDIDVVGFFIDEL